MMCVFILLNAFFPWIHRILLYFSILPCNILNRLEIGCTWYPERVKTAKSLLYFKIIRSFYKKKKKKKMARSAVKYTFIRSNFIFGTLFTLQKLMPA